VHWYQYACDHSVVEACNNLGVIYSQGSGVSQDHKRAVELYRLGCEGFMGGVQVKTTPSETWNQTQQQMAETRFGSSENACYNLAEKLQSGEGAPMDLDRAAALYQRACAKDNGDACFALAKLYEADLGQPEGEGLRMLTAACEQRHPGACLRLGMKTYRGEDLPADPGKAVTYLQRACDKRFGSSACNNLGVLQARGEGTPVNKVEAARLYRGACDAFGAWSTADEDARKELAVQGSATSCYNLSLLYAAGEGGLEADESQAQALRQRACSGAEACVEEPEGSACLPFCAVGFPEDGLHRMDQGSF
jgi:uncharacterized protein